MHKHDRLDGVYGTIQPCHTLYNDQHVASRLVSTAMPSSVFNGADIGTISNCIIAGGNVYYGMLKSLGYLSSDNIINPITKGSKSLQNERTKERKRCPLPTRSFQGRRIILDNMNKCYKKDVDEQKIFVLYGLGGSGKSQLAYKFVEESQQINLYVFCTHSSLHSN